MRYVIWISAKGDTIETRGFGEFHVAVLRAYQYLDILKKAGCKGLQFEVQELDEEAPERDFDPDWFHLYTGAEIRRALGYFETECCPSDPRVEAAIRALKEVAAEILGLHTGAESVEEQKERARISYAD